jgi:mycofactocin precursor
MSDTTVKPATAQTSNDRQPSSQAGSTPTTEPRPDALVEADLLVEDVSIDGMCGVY